jgi:hypothetical protein
MFQPTVALEKSLLRKMSATLRCSSFFVAYIKRKRNLRYFLSSCLCIEPLQFATNALARMISLDQLLAEQPYGVAILSSLTMLLCNFER